MKNNISVSILDAKDKINFLDDLKKVQNQILSLKVRTNIFDMFIHFDVMDKEFVPNEGIDLKYIEDVKKYVPDVSASVVGVISRESIEACRAKAEALGVRFRVR